jgi:hypothetical protein
VHANRASIFVFLLGYVGFGVTLPRANFKLVQSTTASGDQASTKTIQSAPKKISFKNTAMGEMRDEDGVHLGFTNFKASDGSTLTLLYEDFGSPATAQAFLEKQIAKAAKVVDRKNKLSPSGTVVGERAEILLRLSSEKAIPAVLWTDGVKFHEIYSTSRDSVLELERVYRY